MLVPQNVEKGLPCAFFQVAELLCLLYVPPLPSPPLPSSVMVRPDTEHYCFQTPLYLRSKVSSFPYRMVRDGWSRGGQIYNG